MEKSKSSTKKVGIIAFLVFMTVGVLIFVNFGTYRKAAFNTGGGKGLKITGQRESIAKGKTSVYCIDDMIIEAETNTITVKRMDGKKSWSHISTTDIVKIVGTKGNILFANEGRQLVCFTGDKKDKWHYQLNMGVSDLLVDENGNVLVEYEGTEYKKADVFSAEGEGLGSIPMANAYALSFSAGAKDRFSVALMDTSSESVKSKIITYSSNGEMLWANNFENEIITSVCYSNIGENKDNFLIVAGESNLYKFDKNGKLVKKAALGGRISNMALGNQMTAVVVRERGKYVAKSYDKDLTEKGVLKLDKAPDGICLKKDLYIIYDRDQLTAVNIKGEIVTSYEPTVDITGLYISDSDKIYIVSNRKLQRLEFQ